MSSGANRSPASREPFGEPFGGPSDGPRGAPGDKPSASHPTNHQAHLRGAPPDEVEHVLVTFKTNANHPDINMFGTAATSLLKMMGQSGNVPGAIMAEDISAALSSLKEELAAQSEDDAVVPAAESESGAGLLAPDGTGHPNVEDGDEVVPVSLSSRATPLLRMLEAAHAAGASVSWEE